jgi:hypothetical protein
VDSGCTFDFLISEAQFQAWVPLAVRQSMIQSRVFSNVNVVQYQAWLWLHPNLPATTAIDPSQAPYSFLSYRFAVARHGSPLFRGFPLLGLRAFQRGRLRVEFDGPPEHMNIDVF